MQEVLGKLVFLLLELLLGMQSVVLVRVVKAILLRLHHIDIEEVYDLGGVLPRPEPEHLGSIHGHGRHVVIQKGL